MSLARSRFAVFVVAMVLLVAACGGGGGDDPGGGTADEPRVEDEGKPKTGGEIVVAVESETNAFSPHTFAGTAAGINAARAIFDPLLVRDADGKLVPYLAQSITANDELTEFTIKLRPNVSFSVGTKLTALVQTEGFDEFLQAG